LALHQRLPGLREHLPRKYGHGVFPGVDLASSGIDAGQVFGGVQHGGHVPF